MRCRLRHPPSADGLLVTLREDHFDVTALADGSRLTPRSVAAHTLYENADPFHIAEPSGVLDTTDATYEAVDDRTVRVRGARYVPADGYTNKLEGAELVGYQTVIIGGVRDRIVIKTLPELLPMAKHYFDAKIADIFGGKVDPADVDIDYRLYGTGAVLAGHEPDPLDPRELGVLITVTAPDQATAHAVATFVAHASSHLPIPEYDGLVSTLAYPYSPPEMDRGPLYRFTLNHVTTGVTPTEQTYEALVATGFLNKQLFATLYNTAPDNILLVNHPLAVKVSLPRPAVQGELRDTDCYAGQQYAPLMDMEVAPRRPAASTATVGRGHPL
ncbi:DUF4387 family protein [Streptomyces sp. NPDC005794]|uniref:DUF4387 family protein n=1 Tax=Streptomyces sp. NPDC005794 TaxID=3364733 RepID=UPI0036C764AF